ncbi:hypothetical protein OIO07_02350 [Bacillus paralicheniformis]|uniref:hypothetical protein n=1 Tax=Bacillus paralicheniformis TaxID=1648923 RepID=UPI0003422E54|nr:hypothetical protein [Bacillus paralicheniformis]KUL06385.1 hypothetical protein LI7559_21015 [Bacillus licheniformis LMG 7559]AGN38219.1 hypothetical protein BaLi_c39070 [Bacillus paralicheniformis ATCC 9945a]ARA87497.1 hypothetical protein BLMD_19500 [Bacillus paralicheniformis]AYQ18270.1 hypothetical protein D5285_20475 [Bacillus paralicheniformis]MCM3423804.1 hypothetical protein [Bacillus paralicheniformis]
MKKNVMTLFTTTLLVFVFFAGSSEAFAMTSKGAINFQTDANTYSKRATSIVVTGTLDRLNNGAGVFLVNKAGKTVKYTFTGCCNKRSFRVSFSTKNIPAGKYDVIVSTDWGTRNYIGELKHYITVQH